MRILHVVPTYLPATRYGGPIYAVHGLSRALAAEGCDVHVYTTNVDGSGVSDVACGCPVTLDGVHVTYFPTGLGRRVYRAPLMLKALSGASTAFDVIHLHSVFLWPTAAAAAAARAAGTPYIMAPRGMLVDDLIRQKNALIKRAWIQAFERRNLAGAAAVHVTSERESEDLKALGLPFKRIAVIPNGVEVPPQPGDATAWEARRNILFLGRISWKKGLDRLINALAEVPAAVLNIAGNDEEGLTPKLQHQIKCLGLQDRVHFVGPVEGSQKWRLFREADIFVLPSLSENFANTVLEAMAVGCPVIVTKGVGLSRTVSDAGAGIVSAGDPKSLALNIRTLLSNEELRKTMGAAGKRTASEHFAWPTIAKQMINAYQECLAPVTARGRRL